MRELEKIKKERAEQRAREEEAKAAEDAEKREKDIAMGNPLLSKDFSVKRRYASGLEIQVWFLIFDRWDDDVVFKNQARGTEDKRKKEFVNVRRLIAADECSSVS